MNRTWKPVALGKLGEFHGRIDSGTTKETVLSFIEGLVLPDKCKKNILHQLVSRGVVADPAPAGWTQFDPEKAIDFAMEEIRNFKEGE